jgi:protein SCO1/2
VSASTPNDAAISIGVDPERDTPEKLAAYAAGLGAGPGWLWLTGTKAEVDRVLIGLGAYSAKLEWRPIMVLVGDARSGVWTQFLGPPSVDQILNSVNDLAKARMPLN